MKTKDFIKMLQEEDPTGEGYVRVSGGAIYCVESKPGYWDGKYEYYDKETRTLHISASEYKIDVHTISANDIVWEEEGNMENIRKRLKPDFEVYLDKEKDYENFWNNIEKEAIEVKEVCDKLHQEMLERVLEKYKKGWICIYPKDSKSIWDFQWKKGWRKEKPVYGEIEIFRDREHLFDKTEKGKFIYYKLK